MTVEASSTLIAAAPEPMLIELAHTAVLVVDMQNDFGSEGGMFARAGIDIAPIQATIEPTTRVLAAARRAGMRVIYLKMELRPDLSDAGGLASPNWLKHQRLAVGEAVTAPDGSSSRVLIRDAWNTDILPELAPQADDIVISKHRYSGFYGTDLDVVLKSLDIHHLVFTGCTTSVCVESTLRDAMFRDYRCLVLADCVAEPIGNDLPRTNHDASLLVIERLFGWVAESTALLEALSAQTVPARS